MANLYLQDKTKYQVVATLLYVFSGPMGNQYNYICAGVIITITVSYTHLDVYKRQGASCLDGTTTCATSCRPTTPGCAA